MQIIYSFRNLFVLPFLIGLFASVTDAHAASGPVHKCVREGGWKGAADGNWANMGMPNPNITDEQFQKPGTILSSTVKNFLQFAEKGNFSPEQVLFTCPAGQANSLYEMYSTNGDWWWGGWYENEVGKYFGMPHVYSTEAKGLGFRLKNLTTGEYFSHNWKSRSLTDLDRDQYGNLLVKAKNFSNIKLELIRIPDVHPNGDTRSIYSGKDVNTIPNKVQQLGFFAFKGPGIPAPRPGANHKHDSTGFYHYWPGAIGMDKGLNIGRVPTCKINHARSTSSVTFPAMTQGELKAGSVRSANFNIHYECGGNDSHIKMFFLPSAANFNKASDLSLTNNGSTPYLLSDNYNSGSTAKGVAVTIYNRIGTQHKFTNPNNRPLNIGPSAVIPNGVQIGDGYEVDFIAKFGKIPNVPVSPGSYKATARVVIRVN
jgi:Fimbrial protein.